MTIQTIEIQAQLEKDKISKIKSGDKETLSVVRLLIDAIQKKEKDLKRPATHDEVVGVLALFKKQLKEEIEGFSNAGDTLKVEKLDNDVAYVDQYLPEQLSLEDLVIIIKTQVDSLSESGRNIGNAMKLISQLVKGKADGKIVNEVLRNELAQR